MEHHAAPELAIHFHVYQGDAVLLQWYDAFADPMWLSRLFSEVHIESLADRMGTPFRKLEEPY